MPKDAANGDWSSTFAMQCAKPLRMAPPKIAQALAGAWSHEDVASLKAVNGYLNFFLNRENFARDTMHAVLAAPGRWGATNVGEGKTVCLDYSSINIAKRFHIGHLSTTMIGNVDFRVFLHHKADASFMAFSRIAS